MSEHVFCGFGFGPIAAGLFVKEAFESGRFSRIVVAEIDAAIVDAVRHNAGSYFVNVAGSDAVKQVRIDGVEILNPAAEHDRREFLKALAEATEIATCLPSVEFYDKGGGTSVASLIAQGLRHSKSPATIIYTAENNNHAAEILEQIIVKKIGAIPAGKVQFLNTVIGKMSQVVTDPAEIDGRALAPVAPGIRRAFLVEEFNKILVTRACLAGFEPGIDVFIEKDDLLPFEEAKLYGHNAIHALLGFLAELKGYALMTELHDDDAIMRVGRDAFLCESGAALIRKYGRLADPLFTVPGYTEYADDLLRRMTNPHLADSVARTTRDIVRKLGAGDRIFGTMRLALEYGIEPANMALGAAAGLSALLARADEYALPRQLRRPLDHDTVAAILQWIWKDVPGGASAQLADLTFRAVGQLPAFCR